MSYPVHALVDKRIGPDVAPEMRLAPRSAERNPAVRRQSET